MTREEFESFVLDNYNVRADYPFEEDLLTGAFRHESGKWFALAMRISERKLGRDSDASIDVVNLKCAPDVAESLVGVERGVCFSVLHQFHIYSGQPVAHTYFSYGIELFIQRVRG